MRRHRNVNPIINHFTISIPKKTVFQKIHNFKLKTKQAKTKKKKVEFDRQWSQAIDFLPGKLFVQKEAQQLSSTRDAKGPSQQKRR